MHRVTIANDAFVVFVVESTAILTSVLETKNSLFNVFLHAFLVPLQCALATARGTLVLYQNMSEFNRKFPALYIA